MNFKELKNKSKRKEKKTLSIKIDIDLLNEFKQRCKDEKIIQRRFLENLIKKSLK